MELIALLCLQCKAPLDFSGEYIAKCPSCGTPHALIDSGNNLLLSVSYLPYVPALGKMERSLKMQLVAKLRETNFAASGDGWFEKEHIEFEGDKVSFNESIYDGDSAITIGKMTVTPLAKKGFFKRNFNPYVSIEKMCYLWVLPVKVKNGEHSILAGYRIQIKVEGEKFENDVNELSLMIKDWFGVVPEISLQYI